MHVRCLYIFLLLFLGREELTTKEVEGKNNVNTFFGLDRLKKR